MTYEGEPHRKQNRHPQNLRDRVEYLYMQRCHPLVEVRVMVIQPSFEPSLCVARARYHSMKLYFLPTCCACLLARSPLLAANALQVASSAWPFPCLLCKPAPLSSCPVPPLREAGGVRGGCFQWIPTALQAKWCRGEGGEEASSWLQTYDIFLRRHVSPSSSNSQTQLAVPRTKLLKK